MQQPSEKALFELDLQDQEFAQKIQQIAESVRPSLYLRFSLKEKLFTQLSLSDKVQPVEKSFNLDWTSAFSFLPRRLFATAVAMVALVISFYFISIVPTKTTQANFVAELTSSEGLVEVLRGDSFYPITANEKIYVGDTIRVAAQGGTQLRFLDSTTTKLNENTLLKIKSVYVNPEDAKKSIILLDLQKGKLEGDVRNGIEGVFRLGVQTPTSLVEAKKAKFSVEVDQNGETEVSAQEETINVKALANDTQEQRVLAETKVAEGYRLKVKPTVAGAEENAIMEMSSSPQMLTASGSEELSSEEAVASVPAMVLKPSSPVILPILERGNLDALLNKLEFAQVKLMQVLDSLNQPDREFSFKTLLNYQERLAELNVLFFNQEYNRGVVQATTLKELASLYLAGVILDNLNHYSVKEEDKPVLERVRKVLANLALIERSVGRKVVGGESSPTKSVVSENLSSRERNVVRNILNLSALKKGNPESASLRKLVDSELSTLSASLQGEENAMKRQFKLQAVLDNIPATPENQYLFKRMLLVFPREYWPILNKKIEMATK